MSAPNTVLLSLVERACNTETGFEDERTTAISDIAQQVSERRLALLDLVVALQGPLTSPEKEAREHGTRLLGQVLTRARDRLNQGELHTLAEFLAARLRDWPCVGAASAACRALLQPPPPPPPPAAATAATSEEGTGPLAVAVAAAVVPLRDDSAIVVMTAAAEMLRTAQSFRQEERSALLQLLLELAAPGSRWAALAAAASPGRRAGGAGAAGAAGAAAAAAGAAGVEASPQPAQALAPDLLLDAFLGAADGEKDPRCLLLAFQAVQALCAMYHAPGADAAPLRALADELVDWASAYFPIAFNPPPPRPGAGAGAGAQPPQHISRAQLAAALEGALGASPFLAAAALPLMLEKLSSTYRCVWVWVRVWVWV
ncbi:hypothetical protein HYH02_013043 [Chlamydomonas schloesseri]|uniref:MMS19 nucleotide excision repair protein n=1 Tax=Chlamydomonas schloesseri TaxID=2026947 RepID=A0A835SSG9_9CHLO|nr:hypothetical protein HYH02_013043 [Chlamydomonas schloesseri]|eukprot:KAG2432323.1 hypothetical protein HYH02_013043 [Chlamydomonas schloesseri]